MTRPALCHCPALDAAHIHAPAEREPAPLRAGDRLYGFAGGAFGRDSYGPRTVEAVGPDWVIARDDIDRAEVAFADPATLVVYRTARCYSCGIPLLTEFAERGACGACRP